MKSLPRTFGKSIYFDFGAWKKTTSFYTHVFLWIVCYHFNLHFTDSRTSFLKHESLEFYLYLLLMTKKDEGLKTGPCYVNIQSGLCRPGVCSVPGWGCF